MAVRHAVVRAVAVLVPLVVCGRSTGVRDSVAGRQRGAGARARASSAVAATGDRLAGVVAALSSGLWFDFFLTEPYLRLTIDDPDDIQAAVLLVLIGLSRDRARHLGPAPAGAGLAPLGLPRRRARPAAATVSAGSPGPTRWSTSSPPTSPTCWVPTPAATSPGRCATPESRVLDHDGVLTQNGHRRDVDRTGLPVDEYVAIEVRRATRVVGHFEVTAATRVVRPSREQCRVAVLLADQVAPLVEA